MVLKGRLSNQVNDFFLSVEFFWKKMGEFSFLGQVRDKI